MIRLTPISTRTDTLFPDPPLFRSAYVDHVRAGLDPVALDHLGAAHRGDDNVGAAHLIGQIAGAAMRHRHGAIGAEQQLPHRLADEDRAPDDDRILAAEVAEPVVQQQQAAIGRAWHHARDTERETPGADRSEEHTSELQSLMRISYAVFCLKKK